MEVYGGKKSFEPPIIFFTSEEALKVNIRKWKTHNDWAQKWMQEAIWDVPNTGTTLLIVFIKKGEGNETPYAFMSRFSFLATKLKLNLNSGWMNLNSQA